MQPVTDQTPKEVVVAQFHESVLKNTDTLQHSYNSMVSTNDAMKLLLETSKALKAKTVEQEADIRYYKNMAWSAVGTMATTACVAAVIYLTHQCPK